MESGDSKDELNCYICLSLCTDPVSLRCGHNFCRSCIVRVLDTQDGSGGYTCPDCSAEHTECPPLVKRKKLDNTVESISPTQHDMKETRIFCTYCTKSPVPAVKSCLHCEISLCEDHLTAHNNMVDHVLLEPTGVFANKKCPIHKKVLEYYCPQDADCLCVSCCLVGKHRGHQVELLDEASEEKKKELRKNLDELKSQKVETQKRVQNLQDHQKNIQEKGSDKRKNISKILMDIKKQLEMAEKKALSEISRQEEKIVSQISDQIKKLEIKEDELSRKMHHLEEMCRVTDPIRLLQERDITGCGEDTRGDGEKMKSENAGAVSRQADFHLCDTKIQENGTVQNNVLHDVDETDDDDDMDETDDDDVDETVDDVDERDDDDDQDEMTDDMDEVPDDLDEVLISLTLHRSIRDIITNVTSQLSFHVPNILLDEDTAEVFMGLSKDLKTAGDATTKQRRPKSFERFLDYSQVLSRSGFSSGRHYWEVEWNQTGRCDFGMSYPSIKRKGNESCSGENYKSWCLSLEDTEYRVLHNMVVKFLDLDQTSSTLGVFLDYEAGRLSFYELCDPIRHLHTFSASFTEPLHVMFYVNDGASVKIVS